jgi:hypothetical protein
MKMEQTEFSEMWAYKLQMPENYPKESIHNLFSFCGSSQNFKIHMDMEIVNIIHKNNKNICLNGQEVKPV